MKAPGRWQHSWCGSGRTGRPIVAMIGPRRGGGRFPIGRGRRRIDRHRRQTMPKVTVEGFGTFEVADEKRLVLALEDEAKVDQMHACGGFARCTTCRVEF